MKLSQIYNFVLDGHLIIFMSILKLRDNGTLCALNLLSVDNFMTKLSFFE